MTTLRNKRKLAVVRKETQEEHPRNSQSRNTSVPRINEEYITRVSEEIKGRITKKLSQEFSRTESRILGALSKLDEFLWNPQIRTHSGTVPGTFPNTNVENQEPNEDRSQDDPHPEVGPSVCQSPHSVDSDADEAPHTKNSPKHGMVLGTLCQLLLPVSLLNSSIRRTARELDENLLTGINHLITGARPTSHSLAQLDEWEYLKFFGDLKHQY